MHKIDTKVLNATLQYLATRPYADVAQLIQALGQAEEFHDTPASPGLGLGKEIKSEVKKDK